MKTIEATYRIVTPMFMGGANQDPSDGIRPPSFKGALRFWWRALHWGEFLQEENNNEEAALKALHQKEGKLFGSAAKDGKGGQGCFLLSISENMYGHEKKGSVHSDFKKKDAARYLAYGIVVPFTTRDKQTREIKSEAGQLLRGCLNENQKFTVSLKFRGDIDEGVLSALKAVGLLGALGSRSRKGMGSIALEKITDITDKDAPLDIWKAPQTKEAYKKEIACLLNNKKAKNKPFSVLSDESEIAILMSSNDPFEALDQYGKAMLMYRSWGRGGKVLNKSGEKRFKDDHDWYRDNSKVSSDFHPQRVVFGLPHNYGKPDWSHVAPEKHKRRASPLFFHVHPVGNQFVGVGMILKSQFLPVGEGIKAGKRAVPAKIEWDVLMQFFHGKCVEKSDGAPRFPEKEVVVGGQS